MTTLLHSNVKLILFSKLKRLNLATIFSLLILFLLNIFHYETNSHTHYKTNGKNLRLEKNILDQIN